RWARGRDRKGGDGASLPTVYISGVIARAPAAAQVAYQKPHPSTEKHPSHWTAQHIQKPGK
uniref:Uncharacterized protein n=1 Tax=Vombatus ursinus TaxID=29139 RepID=A0A4X2LXZ6_VOMUR